MIWLCYIFLQKSLKKEHFLWNLLNIENDIAKINEDLEAENKSREDLMQEQESCEREASKAKKEQAKYLKEITQFEKRIADRNNKLDKNVSSLGYYLYFFILNLFKFSFPFHCIDELNITMLYDLLHFYSFFWASCIDTFEGLPLIVTQLSWHSMCRSKGFVWYKRTSIPV